MKKNTNKVDCPMCFNSSGFTLYTGSYSQICTDCHGKSVITLDKYKKLKELFKDLIR